MRICENCQTSENEAPVLEYRHKGEEHYVCTRCLPMLIHG